MSKSIYSLVLNDQLVSFLDKVAHKKGMSRSNMINCILAEYLSFETPEKRMEEIFSYVESLVSQTQSLKFIPQTSSLVAISSAISFRYNPTVRYCIELFSGEEEGEGELKVYLRTTNAQLLEEVNRFFWLYKEIEEHYLGATDTKIEGGRYIRRFVLKKGVEIDNQTLGNAITEYVKNFDYLMNLYFSNLGNVGILQAIESEYKNNLVRQKVIFY